MKKSDAVIYYLLLWNKIGCIVKEWRCHWLPVLNDELLHRQNCNVTNFLLLIGSGQMRVKRICSVIVTHFLQVGGCHLPQVRNKNKIVLLTAYYFCNAM